MNLVRGLRNNNPGNIRRTADVWDGESVEQTDPSFVQFLAPEYGIRALVRIMRNHFNAGARTVAELISQWAPPSENDTNAYIAAVSSEMHVDPGSPLDFDAQIPRLVSAVIRHENGINPYTIDTLDAGIRMERSA